LDGNAGFTSGETFSYGYNWDWMENKDSALLTGRYLAGRYSVTSSDSLQSLINKVNAGTQSRVGIELQGSGLQTEIQSGGTLAVCIGEEAYYWGDPDIAGGGTVTLDSFTFSYSNDDWQLGSEGYWANGKLKALLSNAKNLEASVTLNGKSGEVTDEMGQKALQSALAKAFTGMILTETAKNASALGTSAYVKSLGITSANYALGSANFGTGVYAGANGTWTTSATLASAFNLKEVTFNLAGRVKTSGISTTKAALLTAISANGFGSADITCAVGFNISLTPVANSNSYLAKIWYSASTGEWTESATVANALGGFTQLSFQTSATAVRESAASQLSAEVELDFGSTILTAAGFVSAKGYGSITLDVWLGDDAASWTTSATIANKLGYKQLVVNLGSATPVTSAFAISGTPALAAAITANVTAGTFISAAGVQRTGIYINAADNTWTNSAYIASALGNFTELTVTLVGGETAAQKAAKVIDQNRWQWTGLANGPANRINKIGRTMQEAQDRVIAAVNASNPNPPQGLNYVKRVTELGDSKAAMRRRVSDDMFSLGLTKRVSALAGRNIPNTATSLGAALGGLNSNIDGRQITAADVPVAPAAEIAKTQNPPVTEVLKGMIDETKQVFQIGNSSSQSSLFTAKALASAINANSKQFWAMVQSFDSNGRTADMLYVFTREGGNFNDLLACEVAGSDQHSREALDYVAFENAQAAEMHESGTTFTLGGEKWGTMKPTQSKENLGNQVWNVTLNGRDVGKERDLWIANEGEIKTPNLTHGIINGMNRDSFVEIQNAADSPWAGGEIRTQSTAQTALDAISESINIKDKIRADLGALQNRLENTMTNLTVQAENLQASESRISDVDVATEMTEFTRNNVLSQAATSMLAQANSLSQLALSLIR
jgi:flagellin-like hook-associated protein FlgL